mmetsp:Transcript_36542/g.56137  ORF Transcript_36542/g.56137 Transcript_36542/m.56137 type:complete len:161 (-) Transcript_36542:45-527(-)
MVESGYFSSLVPLMRCVKNFLCQFGLAGDPAFTKKFNANIKDDPQWLPSGPSNRENKAGIKRFQKGYLSYAGGGKDTRNNQLFIALADNGQLGGGSPWEVPIGELVGAQSYATLDKIYTGYGEKGPSQGRLHNEGFSEAVKQEFPLLDYITSCVVLDKTQ